MPSVLELWVLEKSLNFVLKGCRIHNEVYPHEWESNHPSNHFSIREFEDFAKITIFWNKIKAGQEAFYRGDWVRKCSVLPNLRAGLAIYELINAED